jgi:hypothetical protein
MANAAGRLLGMLLSGALFLVGGLQACLGCSALLVALAWLSSRDLPAPPDGRRRNGMTAIENRLQTSPLPV